MRQDVRPTIKYTAIYENREKYEVSFMCEFFEVSRSGYYAWVKRREQSDKDEYLGKIIRDCQEKTRYTYGYRRVRIWLMRETGITVNKKAVLRLMRKHNLLPAIRWPHPLYQRQQQMIVYENRLKRDFHADKPNQNGWRIQLSPHKARRPLPFRD